MTAAAPQRSRAAEGTAAPAGRDISGETGKYSVSQEKASQGITSQKFALLRRIMADTSISPIAFRMACLLIWKYRNEKKDGLCCPAAKTIAADLKVNEKTVQRATKELVGGQYFRVDRRGKQQSNLYWPILSDRTQVSYHPSNSDRTFDADVNGHFEPSDRTQVSYESSLEPSLEPMDGHPARPMGLHSTVDGSGSASGDAAPTPRQQRVTYRKGQVVDHPDHGECSVERIAKDHLIIRSMTCGVEYCVGRSLNGEMTDAPF